MKKIHLLSLLLLLFSCTNDKNKEGKTTIITDTIVVKDTILADNEALAKTNTKQKLVGNWKEHWGIGMQTNVNSSDVYQIKLIKNGEVDITCINKKKFVTDQILFDGKELTFRKQNKSYPKGKFYVYYKLKLHDDNNWMEGPITNNKKQNDYVKWEKVNNSD